MLPDAPAPAPRELCQHLGTVVFWKAMWVHWCQLAGWLQLHLGSLRRADPAGEGTEVGGRGKPHGHSLARQDTAGHCPSGARDEAGPPTRSTSPTSTGILPRWKGPIELCFMQHMGLEGQVGQGRREEPLAIY